MRVEHEAPIHDEMMRDMRLLSMMSVDIMMSLIFRCRHYDENRHHDESEHNDGRVSPLVNKGEPHFANRNGVGFGGR
jgi:hypothetical protein